MQKALGKMVGTSSGYLESLPKPVQNRIEYLREVDEKRHALEEEFEAKVKALETEYTALYGAWLRCLEKGSWIKVAMPFGTCMGGTVCIGLLAVLEVK